MTKKQRSQVQQVPTDISEIEKSYYDTRQKSINFLTPNNEQKKLVHSIRNNSVTLVSGNAGTGKTLFCIQTLFQMLKARTINEIIIIRLMSENPHENIGSLPGELKEKTGLYWEAIRDNMELFASEGEINYLFDKDKIKMLPVSFVRGRTFHDKGIIVEEAQNLTSAELMTIITRIGKNSRMIFNGDDAQRDIRQRQGISYLKQLLDGIDDVGVIEFTNKVNERHPLISAIIERKLALDNKWSNEGAFSYEQTLSNLYSYEDYNLKPRSNGLVRSYQHG